MIKNIEVAMVYAANYALNCLNEDNYLDVEKIIKRFLKEFDSPEVKSEIKIYSIAAINEIVKIKSKNKGKSNKQLMQILVKDIPKLSKEIEEEN